ncbi:MAG: His-Xaa-Ser system radical SAM maturase HxsB [Candidatus Omnitrophota bacterium]|jgi:His-Xaa-Ser system radical SAM maturase HxsB
MKNFAVIPFNASRIQDKYLISNTLGNWAFLNDEEFRKIKCFDCERKTDLFKRLYQSGIILDENNRDAALEQFKKLNRHLFLDTGLHIAVITTRCNLNCRYCQTKLSKKSDMSRDTASNLLRCLFDVRNRNVTLEFQGGEPLLNWPTLSFMVENSRKLSEKNGKNLRLALVTNGTLLNENKMKFLTDFNVGICISFDGPQILHDKNRIYYNGRGTYKEVIAKIEFLKKQFQKNVSLLPTITRYSLNYHKQLIDEYVKFSQLTIALRPVNNIGNACANWQKIGYDAEDFINFYIRAMDYILELNKRGVFIKERTAVILLKKILAGVDPGFVDLTNPCGAGRSQITYMPDGGCYPCDESRMLDEEMFMLGNVNQDRYESLMKKDNLLHLLEASVMHCWDYNSVFLPWAGTCPILNYASQNNIVPKIRCSSFNKIQNAQFRYVFKILEKNSEDAIIIKKWVKMEETNG